MTTQSNVEIFIKKVLKDRKISTKQLTRKLRINEKDFMAVLEGKRNLKATEFISICLFLKINIKDLKELNFV